MKKYLMLLLSVIMLCGCVFQSALAANTLNPMPDDALHFIIRHWHSKEDAKGSSFQGDSLDSSGDRYFVVVEGYIVPPASSGTGRYEFYLVYQSDTTVDGVDYKAGTPVMIHNSGYVAGSAYVDKIDHDSGIIILSTNALKKDDDDDAEYFSSYSVSAGHDAVSTIQDSDILTITYKPDIHLVKAHAFYTKNTIEVDTGVEDDTVFGSIETGGSGNTSQDSDEYDTATVYTYKSTGSTYKASDIVKDGDGKPITTGGTLPDGVDLGDVELTKFYDTGAGLHTDKTSTAVEDDSSYVDNDGNLATRTFNLDLEVWNSEGYAPQIAMVLDASGSMGFASGELTVIDVNAIIADLNANGKTNEAAALSAKIGSGFTKQVNFPQRDHLIGYYEFQQNSNGNARTWFLNTVSGGDPANYWKANGGVDGAKQDHFAKAVAHPSDDSIDFATGQKTLISCGDYNGVTGWGSVPLNFNDTNGFCLENTTQEALLLEVAPQTADFTLSFSLNQTKASTNTGRIEILYIGALTGNINNPDYFHVYRDDADIVAELGKGNTLFRLSNLYDGNVSNHTLTFVFKGNTMTAYVDGVAKATGQSLSLAGRNVVFAPFENDIQGTDKQYFYLDNVYLYDTALDGADITYLSSAAGQSLDATVTVENFLTAEEQALILNPRHTDNSKLSGSGYSYFVYDARSNTAAYTPLGYYADNAVAPVTPTAGAGAGWYYSSYSGAWNTYLGGTAKTLQGITAGRDFTDTIDFDSTTVEVAGTGAAPHLDSGEYHGNTGLTYKAESVSPVKFYIDTQGYLRCLFDTGISNDSSPRHFVSYVYELADSEYIRTESLQRALGLFVTKLDEHSPSARVCAVRFSAKDIPDEDLKKLVLLDWTDDPAVSTGMLSLNWGVGTSSSSTTSDNNVGQYNYGLTGGTVTENGLNAYITTLKNNDNPYSDNVRDEVPRYLILFTDGVNTGKRENSEAAAKKLKDDGYTIYTILLDGGLMSDADYNAAHDFLLTLSGKNGDSDAEKYFYSTRKNTNTNTANDADTLTSIFVDSILDQIIEPLEDYAVQDYIDPRFDLVDKDGVVWHLNANGVVNKVTADGMMLLDLVDTENGAIFPLSDKSDEGAREPLLYYDSTTDMYYLKWVDQDIPTSVVGASRLAVWNAQITIRAKEDFLGGNAVLSNGHDQMMNYVYAMTDSAPSSGTDRANPSKGSGTPSKGFPRTAVNVTPAEERLDLTQIIYMSEDLYSARIAEDLINATKEQAVGMERYYWEYLERFVAYFNKDGNLAQLEELKSRKDNAGNSVITDRMFNAAKNGELSVTLLTDWMVEDRITGLTLPYIYLPDQEESNSTGTETHRKDVIGQLNYIIKETFSNADQAKIPDGYDVYPDGPTTHTVTRLSELKVTYYSEESVKRMAWNNTNVVEDDHYKRDPTYKPVCGRLAPHNIVINGSFVTKIVSGDIVLQVVVGEEATNIIRQGNLNITYTADLYWDTNDLEWDNPADHVQKGKYLIGTFTATVNPTTLRNGRIINATVTYNDYAGYLMEKYGLPLGTYTLENGTATNLIKGLSFSDIVLIHGADDWIPGKNQVYNMPYRQPTVFPRGVGNNTPYDFVAVDNGSAFLLGNNMQNLLGRRYTNYRFGLFQVSLTSDSDALDTVPQTGDNSNIQMWIALMFIAIAGMVAFYPRRKTTKGRR